MTHIESIKVRKVNYTKPLALIYNPNSGKKINVRPKIEQRLKKEGISFEFIPTKKAGDTYVIAHELDYSKYSALIAVGGDGSANEVFNGMLTRPDGAKLPCGYIPNGSGNMTATETGVYSVEDSLDTIVARTVTKLSAIECMADHEDSSTLPAGFEGFQFRRYSFLGVNMGNMSKRWMMAANQFKSKMGNGAYVFAFAKYLCCGVPKYREKYEVTLDGVPEINEGEASFYTAHLGAA